MNISFYCETERRAVLDLWARALPLDAVTEATFETRILLDENFDPSTFLLARDGTQLAGFVLGMYPRHLPIGDADPAGTRAWITALGVDPSGVLPEIAGVLLERLERQFRSLGKRDILVSTYPPGYFTPGIDRDAYRPLLDFLLSREYAEQKQALSMDAPIVLFQVPENVIALEARLRADGIIVRPYQRTDLLEFLGFLEQTMPTDWVRVERANLKKISSGTFSTDHITVVTHAGSIIGYCQFEGSHFGPFGVSEGFQGRGIGTVLLARTLERMRQHGYHDAWVMWTDDKAASVYRKFGFKETRRFSILRKEL
jgi:ribosomal protein S18 acetylase RimI-like enzyme